MEKLLKLYVYVDGDVGGVPFPNAEDQIEIGAFRYDAKRMGGAPTITASVNYPSCLDDEWTDNVYAEFNGEKYFLKQTPTSSYDNVDAMYKHDVELVSERVALDNVYFFDVVTGDPMDSDKPVSNSTKVVFFGDVRDFASRLQASLDYSGLDYTVEVDEDDRISNEEKLISFEDQFFSNVLQEIYNAYEVPYYFDGKTIHIGFAKNQELPTFAYGVDDALISITKNNANYKIVNRATGTGSSDNIPFYYPNNSPKGDLVVEILPEDAQIDVAIVDMEKFSDKVEVGGEIEYKDYAAKINGAYTLKSMTQSSVYVSGSRYPIRFSNRGYKASYFIDIYSSYDTELPMYFNPLYSFSFEGNSVSAKSVTTLVFSNDTQVASLTYGSEVKIPLKRGKNVVAIYVSYNMGEVYSSDLFDGNIGLEFSLVGDECWYYKDKAVELSDLGLKLVDGEPLDGFIIRQKGTRYINPTQNLMPPKYRESNGANRFYNATNNTYEGITFNNPFVAGRPKEHIIKVEDIKPTIEGAVNSMGLRMDMFSEFAYDLNDNDDLEENEEGTSSDYVHSYFFGKLRKLDFNLFDHAIENQPMVISFTSGDCGACNFEIGVTEEFPQKNPVQVNSDGTIKRNPETGNVICGQFEEISEDECQPQQQDTINNEVWIALKKEDSTYGILMPKAPVDGVGGHRPSTNDTFAILGINLPYEYIENAEKKLEAEIIKYLQNNNDEKFTFSISFSRIYFEENPDVLALLSENSKIQITYNNKNYDLYVSSFSYSMGEGDVLPEIRIELDETLKTSQNALQNAISEVKSTLGNAINQVSYKISTQSRSYVSKVEDDTALGTVDFSKGIKFGEGGKVDILENNSAKLTIEYLEVTKKASFTSLEIQEKTHVGGQILVTPAAINCGEVEEFDNYYRCYFQTKGEDGEEIFNQFAVGDQAICQTFNAWGSRYYWRLVVGIGNDYIDLSKTDYDDGSGIPQAGDKIVQMGNRSDASRQNAIVIAAYGNGSPYIIQYKGINNYLLPTTSEDERIMTKLSPTENILTGLVRMKAGSSGLEKFTEWQSKQELIDSKASKGDFEDFKAIVEDDLDLIKRQVDGAITTWFYDPVPTLENAPAVEWTTEDDKINHLGDLYYSGEGKAYRFQYDNGTSTYYWNVITDTDIIKALADAKRAQDTADGKRRVFVTQPYPPYDEGDLWSRGSEFPMMVCVNSRESGSYVASDWDFADNNNQLSQEIAGYEYLKEAIQNGDTVVVGGLIQSGVLMLGYNDAYGNYHVMSGTNGIYRANEVGGGIAAWWGGDMSESLAKAIIRFDGTGFLANGNIRWDEEGGAEFGGGDFKILADGSIIFGEDIKISTEGDETLGSILTELNNRVTKAEFNTWKTDVFNPLSTKVNDHTDKINKILSWFELREDEDLLITTHNLASYKEISSNGISQGTGGGGSGLISSVLGVGSLGATLANDNSVVFNAYATNEIYKATQGHASRIGVLESQVGQLTTQSTKVSVSDLLTTGTKIATITVDGVPHEVKGDFLPTSGGKMIVGKVIQWGDTKNMIYATTNAMHIASASNLFVNNNEVLHAGNYSSYALPLTGGTLNNGAFNPLTIKGNSSYSGIGFAIGSNAASYLIYAGGNNWHVTSEGWLASYNLLHEGNYSQYALPLSGGTISGSGAFILSINRTQGDPLIAFYANNALMGFWGVDLNGTPIFADSAGTRKYVIHSGNVGEYKAGDSELLGGYNRRRISSYVFGGDYREIAEGTDLNSLCGSESCGIWNAKDNVAYTNAPMTNFGLMSFRLNSLYFGQLVFPYGKNYDNPRYRSEYYSSSGKKEWSDWRTIAFTDSNVASATKLATKRKLWGNDFDGTGNVNGNLFLNNQSAIQSYTTSGTQLELFNISSNNNLSIGYSMAGVGGSYIYGNAIYLRYGSSRTTGFILNSSGNVTIGSSDLATEANGNPKLYVNGNTKLNGEVNILGERGIYQINSSGSYYLYLGHDESSKRTHLFNLQSNSYLALYDDTRIVIGGGNVGIGTATDLGYKLNVAGDIASSGALRMGLNSAYGAYLQTNDEGGWTGIYSANKGNWQATNMYFMPNGDVRFAHAARVIGKNTDGDTGLFVEGTQYSMWFGIGSGNVNRGIYDINNNGWWIYRGSDTLTRISGGIETSTGSFTGAVTMSSTLTIAGATTHNGIAYFGGTTYYINTSGNAHFNAISGSSLQVDSAAFNDTIHSNEYSGSVAKWSITNDGAASFASLSNGGLLETSTLRVSSTSTFTGKTNHNGGIGATSLNVSGTSTLSGHVGIGTSPHSTYSLYVDGSLCCGPIDGGTASLGALYSNTHVPNYNNTYDLGSNSYRWASIYGVGADFSGNVTVNGTLYANGTLYTNDIDGSNIYITASGNLYLTTASGYFGAQNQRWAIDGYGNYKGQSLYINPRDNDNEIITDNNKKKTHGFPREGVAVFVNGDIAATGEISANALNQGSDIRFKNQLGDITLDLDTIANAPMFRFTWTNKENSRVQIGTSAQYWKDSARELVSVDKDDFHRLDYATLGVLIGVTLGKTVKNHEDRIKELEREVVELKEENRRLRYGN